MWRKETRQSICFEKRFFIFHLGVTIHEDGRDNEDILKKIGKGKNIIKALHPILWNKTLTKKTKNVPR